MGSLMDKVNQVCGSGGGKNVSVQLTTTGDDKLMKIHAGGAEYQILSAIKRHEPCTVGEVARDAQMTKYTYDQIRDVMLSFLDRGWIMYSPIAGR